MTDELLEILLREMSLILSSIAWLCYSYNSPFSEPKFYLHWISSNQMRLEAKVTGVYSNEAYAKYYLHFQFIHVKVGMLILFLTWIFIFNWFIGKTCESCVILVGVVKLCQFFSFLNLILVLIFQIFFYQLCIDLIIIIFCETFLWKFCFETVREEIVHSKLDI